MLAMNASKWTVPRSQPEPPPTAQLHAAQRCLETALGFSGVHFDRVHGFGDAMRDLRANGRSIGFSTIIPPKQWGEITEEEEKLLAQQVHRFFVDGVYAEPVVWYPSLKDEIIKKDKLEHGKVRAFAGAPALYTLLTKMVFGPQQHWLSNNHPRTVLKDGLGKFKGGLQLVYAQAESMLRPGDVVLSADARQNDANLPGWVAKAIMEVRYEAMRPDLAAKARQLWDLQDCSLLDFGDGYQVPWNRRGILSGNFLTMTNTGLGMLLLHSLAAVRGVVARPIAFKGDDRIVIIPRTEIESYLMLHNDNDCTLVIDTDHTPYGLDFCSTTVKIVGSVALTLSSRPGKILASLMYHATRANVLELFASCVNELACDRGAIQVLNRVAAYIKEMGWGKVTTMNVPQLEALYCLPFGHLRQKVWVLDPAESPGLNFDVEAPRKTQ